MLSLLKQTGITRIPSIKAGEKVEAPDIPDFYEYVRSCAEVFHELINPAKNTTRFLGNTSFRCRSGFPSFRVDNGIFVSRRNIDKRHISKDAFVFACLGENGETMYFGDQKPSVDTPIQLRLYNLFPKINFMIHGHCYVDNGIFTQFPIPCGGIEEVKEILKIVPDTEGTRYAINLIGHGCLLMGATVKDLKCFKFISNS